MRLIPGKIKVQVELFKKVTLADIFVGAIAMIMILFVLISSLPGKLYICIGVALLAAGLLARIDTVPNYIYFLHILRYFGLKRHYGRTVDDQTLETDGQTAQINPELAYQSGESAPVSEGSRKKVSAAQSASRRSLNPKQKTIAHRSKEMVRKSGETKQQKAAREARRKKEDRILNSKTAPDEMKAAIRNRRAREAKEYARQSAIAKEASLDRQPMEDIIAFTDIRDNCIEYGGKYYGAAIEIPPVELRFFSESRRTNTIESSLGRLLRTINAEFSANIVKLERPILYDQHLNKEYDRLDDLKLAFENGLLKEDEYQARVEILYNRIHEVRSMCYDKKVIAPYYCLVLFESDKRQLENLVYTALNTLRAGEMNPHRLNTEELAIFLKYSNQLDFDERSIKNVHPEDYAQWAMPKTLDFHPRSVEVNHIITYTMRMVSYPTLVGDAWLAGVMSMPGTKCVVKFRPMDRTKAIRGIDRSLQELRGQMAATGLDSKQMELQSHIETLSELLATLQRDNESLMEANIYVTAYDIAATRDNNALIQPPPSELPNITNMKKAVRRLYQESGFRLNNMEFDQTLAFIGSQISGWDPMLKDSRGIPSNSLAACYPWIYAHVSDDGGFKLGSSDGVPVMIDFFRRDSERVNSNMVIVGKSGSGKSYATKNILENLAAENCKIFILDPENEYAELANNLHGKFINVGNAQFGRLNPFHIITALDDDEEDGSTVSGSYATHLQFLEEFFRQILPDCDRDAMEYLNNMIDRMYTDHGITAETDLSKLRPGDYPIFDDLYDAIMQEFQQTDNEYIRSILRILMNYIAKFSTGGRNANIWNGPSTITTDENFTVFNFQSLLANRNSTIANAQMLLILKYIDNEIIKNRDYNLRYHLNRKVAVVIDEAHVFIDTKFPIALDFMFQLAKRIRKYNGMQIVITQNIKDFVGSEEIARKSTAIINACQYSMIFALAPNDIQDLCRLYEKAGGINEKEQEEITSALRGQAFTIMSPSSRTSFQIEVPADSAAMFEEQQFVSRYFAGADGAETWEEIVGDSRWKHQKKQLQRWGNDEDTKPVSSGRSYVTFAEIKEEDAPTVAPATAPKVHKTVRLQEESPAEPMTVPPSVPVAVTPSDSAEPSATEKLLSELLGKFSYSSMVEEIRRTVREEMARELSLNNQRSVGPATRQETSSSVAEQTMSAPAVLVQESVPSAEAVWEEPPEFDVGNDEETESAAYHQEDVSFNIMDLLAQQAEKLQDVNPIDMMTAYDEDVIDVSLEELTRYNQKAQHHSDAE